MTPSDLINYQDPDKAIFEPETRKIFGEQYEPVLIPCKPTTPNVELKLIDENGTPISCLYDPHEGFTVVFNESTHDKVITCEVQVLMIDGTQNNINNREIFVINIGEKSMNGFRYTASSRYAMFTMIKICFISNIWNSGIPNI